MTHVKYFVKENLSYTTNLDPAIPTERRIELVNRFMKWRRVKNKKYQYLRKYNLSLDDINKMKEDQNNCCAICKKDLEAGNKTHIDHNHYTGKIRGILCSRCNLGLGNFKDDTTSLANAIIYLNENDG